MERIERILASYKSQFRDKQFSLNEFRKEAAQIKREINERKKKVLDLKGKVSCLSAPESLLATPFSFTPIATFEGDSLDGTLIFFPPYRRALQGLGEFERAWVISLRKGPAGPTACVPAAPEGTRLHLSLVEIADVQADQGRVAVRGFDAPPEAAILDLKIYLPFVESLEGLAQAPQPIQGDP